jgi:hypothetical protein
VPHHRHMGLHRLLPCDEFCENSSDPSAAIPLVCAGSAVTSAIVKRHPIPNAIPHPFEVRLIETSIRMSGIGRARSDPDDFGESRLQSPDRVGKIPGAREIVPGGMGLCAARAWQGCDQAYSR